MIAYLTFAVPCLVIIWAILSLRRMTKEISLLHEEMAQVLKAGNVRHRELEQLLSFMKSMERRYRDILHRREHLEVFEKQKKENNK